MPRFGEELIDPQPNVPFPRSKFSYVSPDSFGHGMASAVFGRLRG
jgi:hypothetical protein